MTHPLHTENFARQKDGVILSENRQRYINEQKSPWMCKSSGKQVDAKFGEHNIKSSKSA